MLFRKSSFRPRVYETGLNDKPRSLFESQLFLLINFTTKNFSKKADDGKNIVT